MSFVSFASRNCRMSAGLLWGWVTMRDNLVRELLKAHEQDCKEDRERTRAAFSEVQHAQEASEARIAARQMTMHTENGARFDKIESQNGRVLFGVMLILLTVLGYLAQHYIGKI